MTILIAALMLAQQSTPFTQTKMITLPKEAVAPAAETPPPSALNDKATILIQAKARADDLVQAFAAFKKEKPTYRIAARLANGSSLTDIIELTAMSQGTLFIAKISTAMGIKTQLVSVNDIIDFYFP
jgi:hypothetical protein